MNSHFPHSPLPPDIVSDGNAALLERMPVSIARTVKAIISAGSPIHIAVTGPGVTVARMARASDAPGMNDRPISMDPAMRDPAMRRVRPAPPASPGRSPHPSSC